MSAPLKVQVFGFCLGLFFVFVQKLGRGFLFFDNREGDYHGLNCVTHPTKTDLVKS